MIPVFVLTWVYVGNDTVQDAATMLDAPRPFLSREKAEEAAQHCYDSAELTSGPQDTRLCWRRTPQDDVSFPAEAEWTSDSVSDGNETVGSAFRFMIRKFTLGG